MLDVERLGSDLAVKEDGIVIDTIPLVAFDSPEEALDITTFLLKKVYSLASKTLFAPSKMALAYKAHRKAEYYLEIANNFRKTNKLDEKVNLELSYQFDDIADRFANGQRPTLIYNKLNKVCDFLVRGEHGHAYSVDIGGSSCSCQAGRNNKECWHVRMVDIYLEVLKDE